MWTAVTSQVRSSSNLLYLRENVSASRLRHQTPATCFIRAFQSTNTPESRVRGSRRASAIFDLNVLKKSETGAKEESMPEPPAKVIGDFGDPVKTEARRKHDEHRYSTTNFRISPKKLTFIARQIAGKNINEAIKQMEFSPKKASKKIVNSLITARDHAWRYKMMDPKKLYIDQAWVGKGFYRKKRVYGARGRMNFLKLKKAHMKYIFKEAEKEGGEKPRKNPFGERQIRLKRYWVPLKEYKPIYNPAPYYNW